MISIDGIIRTLTLSVLFIAIFLSILFSISDNKEISTVEEFCSMAEGPEDPSEMFRQAGKSAFVLGYTGETGTLLIKELANDKLFTKVVLIGRRKIDLPPEFGPEFEQRVVDFDKLDDYADDFKGLDVGFCLLGTTRGKDGADGFVRVDRDYVVNAAALAKAGGTNHFQLVSTVGANAASSSLLAKTKGQAEEAVKGLQFQRLSIFRPGLLMVDRKESRLFESFARFVLRPVASLFPTLITIPVRNVARALINNAVISTDKAYELFENKQVHILSKYTGCGSPLTTKDS